VSSGGVQTTKSTSGTKVRARDKSLAFKEVASSYSKKVGHIVTTWRAWEAFIFSLGSDIRKHASEHTARATPYYIMFSPPAKKPRIIRSSRTSTYAVPSYEEQTEFLPRIKRKLGFGTSYLAALF
jgi:hypothetical protein